MTTIGKFGKPSLQIWIAILANLDVNHCSWMQPLQAWKTIVACLLDCKTFVEGWLPMCKNAGGSKPHLL